MNSIDNKFIKRKTVTTIREHAQYLPVIAIVGPRQSGKSTLVKSSFPDYKYYNLEDETVYQRAIDDPSGFIKNCPYKTIIDEDQLAPRLFNAIQLCVDNSQKPGHFILTGSHNFLLLESISQSLAGRVALITLLPLSFEELWLYKVETNTHIKIKNSDKLFSFINESILKGAYPRLYSTDVPQNIFYRNYIKTYISRDVQGFLDVRNATTFNKFLGLLAQDIGGIVNYSRYANDLNVDVRTISKWLSIFVAGYVVYLLPPYSTNSRKQLIKSPRIYFYDTGLACYLNKIKTEEDLVEHTLFGKIYENFVIIDLIKKYTNKAEDYDITYYRDKHKNEIDLIDNSSNQIVATEIKSAFGYNKKYEKVLLRSSELLNSSNILKQLLFRGEESFSSSDVHVICERDWFLFQ